MACLNSSIFAGVSGPAMLIFRLVWREIPYSLRHFSVLIACIALGVGAIVAVGSLSRALNEGLAREGRVILGADAAFTLIQRPASEMELAAISTHGAVSLATFSRAMALTAAGEAALVEIKAVDGAYPVAGALDLAMADGPEKRELASLLATNNSGAHGLVVDPILTGRLSLGLGDSIRIGEGQFFIAAHLVSEPDKLSGGFGFGPRVIMSEAGLAATGLVQPGALTRFTYRLDLGPGVDDAVLRRTLDEIARATPDAGWQVASRMRASPNLQRQIGRFTQFLSLVGLTALLIGGIGVANAARAFAEGQTMRIATLKSLGASRRFVLFSALVQVLAFALIGIVIGLVLGAVLPMLPRLVTGFSARLLPFSLEFGFYPQEWLLGLAYGLVTTTTFALLPLLRARATPPSTLFRDEASGAEWRPGLIDIALIVFALLAFAIMVITTATDRRIAMIFLAAATGALVVLRLIAFAVMRIARALPRPRLPVARLALANLYRPGALTPSVVLSLGLGLTLLVTLALIDINLSRQFRAALPGLAPSFFFVDIPSREAERFEAFLKAETQGALIERVPQLRGRIIALKGVPAAEIKAAERVSWVLDGDRGITFAAKLPEGSRIAAGEWWLEDYRGPPLVSFAKDIAVELGLKVDDEIIVNVLGRRIGARIANLREVRWQRLGINFVMVFSPNTFAGAPYSALATLTLPPAMPSSEEARIARSVAKTFPSISAVRVKDAIAAVDSIVTQLGLAIRVSSAIALLASILVLGGALAASARMRQREGVILKTLGATRRTLLAAMLIEYAALGAIAVVFGVGCGAAGAALVVSGIMGLEFTLPLIPAVTIAVLAFVATIVLGLAGTWHILGQKPATYLRHA